MAKPKEMTYDGTGANASPVNDAPTLNTSQQVAQPKQTAVGGKSVLMGDGKSYAVAKQVTFLHLTHPPGAVMHVKILDAIFTGRALKEAKNKKPARMVHVQDLSDGIAKTYIVAAVLEGELVRCYPPLDAATGKELLPGLLDENGYPPDGTPVKWTYVGRAFSIRKSEEAREGKGGDYYTYEILELAEVSESGEVAA